MTNMEMEWNAFCEKPLEVIDEWAEKNGYDPEKYIAQVHAFLSANPHSVQQIPRLSLATVESIKNHSLVRFRCMVQDNSLSMEVSPRRASLQHQSSPESKDICMLFRDEIFGLTDEWEFCHPQHSEYYQKQPHACISIPGEASWARESAPVSSEDFLNSLTIRDPSDVSVSRLGGDKVHPQSDRLHVLVKTYLPDENLLLNDVIEVIGIFERGLASDDSRDDFGDVSLDSWPRIHTLRVEVLKREKLYAPAHELLATEKKLSDAIAVDQIRESIIQNLQSLFYNDRLVSEFVFLHLFSSISNRVAGYPVGFMPLNLCHLPEGQTQNLSGCLRGYLNQLMPLVVNIDLSLNILNKDSWMFPRMGQAGLSTGLLQVADGTLVIVDETKLTDGKLEGRGVANLTALKDTLMSATVMYEIASESHMEKPLDASFLILSHGKSMLPAGCIVPLHAQTSESQQPMLSNAIAPQARAFLHAARYLNVTIPSNMEEVISHDFTKAQEAIRAAGNRTPDDGTLLTTRLNVARLIAKSYGLSELNQTCWDMAGTLEEQRLERLASLPQRRVDQAQPGSRADPPRR